MPELIWIALLLALNFGISWWNAYVVGCNWLESRMVGGSVRFVMWCGAVQSAIGFSSVFLCAFGGVAYVAGWLPPEAVEPMVSLWYLLVVFPLLGSGFAITALGWQETLREPNLARIGTSAWNTYAQVHNTAEAFNGIGPALEAVGKLFGSLLKGGGGRDDAKARLTMAVALLVILIAICALLSGAVLTAFLVKRYAGTLSVAGREAHAD